MFYCEDCKDKRDYPESFMRSFGPCEICKKRDWCYDVPSGYLPDFLATPSVPRLAETYERFVSQDAGS